MSNQLVKGVRTVLGDLKIDYNSLSNAPKVPDGYNNEYDIVLTDKTTKYEPNTTDGNKLGTLTINGESQEVEVTLLDIEHGGTNATDAATARENLEITLENLGAAPAEHTHPYAEASEETEGAAKKVQSSLVMSLNGGETEGTDLFTFDGSEGKTVNITPDAIGAASADHIHDDYDGLIVKNENPANASLKALRGISAVGTFGPIIDGTGVPSNANIRPISARTSVRVVHCGKNLLNATADLSEDVQTQGDYKVIISSGITFKVYEDNKVIVNGTSTGSAYLDIFSDTLPANSYIISMGDAELPHGVEITCSDINSDLFNIKSGVAKQEIKLTEPSKIRIRIDASLGKNISDLTFYPMICQSSIFDGIHEAYRGAECVVKFDEGVYGGKIDWQTGELTVNKILLTLDGTEGTYAENFNYGPSLIQCSLFDANFTTVKDTDISTECVCSHLQTKSLQDLITNSDENGIAVKNSTDVYIRSGAYSVSVDSWLRYISDQAEYGEPVQLVIACEPYVIQLDKQNFMQAFDGVNTVYSDTDELEVTFNHDRFITDRDNSDGNFKTRVVNSHMFEFKSDEPNLTFTARMQHNNLLWRNPENSPTPDKPVGLPLQREYFLYHAASINLFDKNTLDYGYNVDAESVYCATSQNIYLHRSSDKPLYVSAYKIPGNLSVSIALCYKNSYGESKVDTENLYPIMAGMTREFTSNLSIASDPTMYLNSIRLVIRRIEEDSELAIEDVKDLQLMVSLEPISSDYESSDYTDYTEGPVKLYRQQLGVWNEGSRYAGVLDYDRDIFEINYACLKFKDFNYTWHRQPLNNSNYVLYYAENVIFDAFTSDELFCTHYPVVDAKNSENLAVAMTYSNGTLMFYDNNPNITDADSFQDHLIELNGMIIYKRSTPISYKITSPNIYCYEGMNYLYTSCDEMTVKYNIPWINAGIVYNTAETSTNDIWIDGKPIYRKVFELGVVNKNKEAKVPTGIKDLGAVVSLRGIGFSSDGKNAYVLPYAHATDADNVALRLIDCLTAPQIYIKTGSNIKLINIVIIIEYTKAEDYSVIGRG